MCSAQLCSTASCICQRHRQKSADVRGTDIINSVVSTTTEDRKKAAEEHRKNIQQSTGGGHFSKIDQHEKYVNLDKHIRWSRGVRPETGNTNTKYFKSTWTNIQPCDAFSACHENKIYFVLNSTFTLLFVSSRTSTQKHEHCTTKSDFLLKVFERRQQASCP